MLHCGLGFFERVRVHVVLEFREGLAECRGEEIGASGDPLPKLDEGRSGSLHSLQQQRKPALLHLFGIQQKTTKNQRTLLVVRSLQPKKEKKEKERKREKEEEEEEEGLTLGKSQVRTPSTAAGKKMRESLPNLKTDSTSSTSLHGCLRGEGALARRAASADPMATAA